MCENRISETAFGLSEVQGYISQLDSIINRMGSNSSNAKNWLMTIIAAAIAIQWSGDQLKQVIWLLLPTLLFMLTDMYYLGMERRFKDIQKEFINAVREKTDISNLVYNIPQTSKCEQVCNTLKALDSLSIWPFYSIVIMAIAFIWYLN